MFLKALVMHMKEKSRYLYYRKQKQINGYNKNVRMQREKSPILAPQEE